MTIMHGKMCPKCGREEDAAEFVGAFCAECFAEKHHACEIPRKLEAEYCTSCERMRLGEWTTPSDRAVMQWILGKSKVKCETEHASIKLLRGRQFWTATLKLSFRAEGKTIEREQNVRVNIKRGQCSECSRRSSGYFEAIIQLRRASPETPAEKIPRTAAKLTRKLEHSSFISKIEEQKEGIDLYVGSVQAARGALEMLGKGFDISKTLAGRKAGKEVYRTTFCVRL